jgi:hypothetical protein
MIHPEFSLEFRFATLPEKPIPGKYFQWFVAYVIGGKLNDRTRLNVAGSVDVVA